MLTSSTLNDEVGRRSKLFCPVTFTYRDYVSVLLSDDVSVLLSDDVGASTGCGAFLEFLAWQRERKVGPLFKACTFRLTACSV